MKRRHFFWVHRFLSGSFLAERRQKNNPGDRYARRIQEYLERQLNAKEQKASIDNILPSIAFRECFPLRNSAALGGRLADVAELTHAGPLRPYLLPDQRYNIPRKSDLDIAKWLATCFTTYSSTKRRAVPKILVFGDSETDLALALNLAGLTPPTPRVGCTIMNSKLDPKTVKNLTCRVARSWAEWESGTEALLDEFGKTRIWAAIDKQKYLICDIDKTLIMPEGHAPSESALQDLRTSAYTRLLEKFFLREIGSDEARKLYDQSKNFPPYLRGAGKGDEDVRVVGAVLLGLDLAPPGSWDDGKGETLTEYLHNAVQDAKRNNLSTRSANIIHQLYERERQGVPTILEEFRECEHETFLQLQKNGRYFINGRVLRCLKSACMKGWIPVGYSDRPSASVGLRIDAHHLTAWPTVPNALISLPGNIVLPD